MVKFPPNEVNDAKGWARALLSDLAGEPELAAELLEAIWDVQSGRLPEWSMQYNVYFVELGASEARITFTGFADAFCALPLDVLSRVVATHIGLE